MLTRAERRFLDSIGAPAWENSPANRLTVWRARAAVLACQLYWIYLLGGAPYRWLLFVSLIVVVIAAVLDGVDGYLARTYGQTDFGRFIDPTADKLIASCVFVIVLIEFDERLWLAVPILANWYYDYKVMQLRRLDPSMSANTAAKLKQIFVFMSCFGLLLAIPLQGTGIVEIIRFEYTKLFGLLALWFTLPLLLISGAIYFNAYLALKRISFGRAFAELRIASFL